MLALGDAPGSIRFDAPTFPGQQGKEDYMLVINRSLVEDRRGVDLISDALPFGRLWYGEPNAVSNAIGYAKFFSRSHDAVIRVYDEAGQRDRDARARGRVCHSGRRRDSSPARALTP
jgi:hypothetical protein